MAKKTKQSKKFDRKVGHIRLICPHCNRHVTVQRPTAFQRAMPCPNCRIPIASEFIIATSEETTESDVPDQEESHEDSVVEEATANEGE